MKKGKWIIVVAIVLIAVGVILEFTVGSMFSAENHCLNYFVAGDYVCGIFAAGDHACGIFAVGEFSIGIFSAGIFSIGIFSTGLFNIGVYSAGLFVFAWKRFLPKTISDLLKSNQA